ncbi:MAG TPA: TRAP transporter substrate-binding protein [Desulfobacteraceae bacterium]|nr:TRAP transporter substrate-binding protein [Desulfobacteraceae bacterium]HPJ67788.1 TRAP transporter substrate-binding protein [Desulfobacteraceae bacterium]HPQ28053.1 TRAP transporter substrate-binding protein [Desulfobacteraceae bacterium]
MKKSGFLLILIFLVGISFLALGNSVANAATELTYSCFFPPTHIQSKLAEAWCKEVEKRTNGEVKITYYPGQTLTKSNQCYDGTVQGISDIGFSVLQYTRGRFPMMDFINLPMGFPNGRVATAIINEVLEKFQPAELTDTRVMYLHSHGPGTIHVKDKAVHTMEDLKGIKIRSHGPTAEMIKALGGTPVAFPMPELYQALQKGVVNGGIYPMEANKGWRLGEVTDYAISCNSVGYGLGFFVVMNKGKWDKLPDGVKKVIDEINSEWILKHGAAWDDSDFEGIQFMLSKGNTIIGIAPDEAKKWKNAVKVVIDQYEKETKEKGVPGDKVIEYVNKRLEEAGSGKFTSKYMTSD